MARYSSHVRTSGTRETSSTLAAKRGKYLNTTSSVWIFIYVEVMKIGQDFLLALYGKVGRIQSHVLRLEET